MDKRLRCIFIGPEEVFTCGDLPWTSPLRPRTSDTTVNTIPWLYRRWIPQAYGRLWTQEHTHYELPSTFVARSALLLVEQSSARTLSVWLSTLIVTMTAHDTWFAVTSVVCIAADSLTVIARLEFFEGKYGLIARRQAENLYTLSVFRISK